MSEFNKILQIESKKERAKVLDSLLTVAEKKSMLKMLKCVQLVQNGYSERQITRTIGLGNSTLKAWLKRGEECLELADKESKDIFEYDDFLYAEFSMSYYQHKVDYQNKMKNHVEKAAEGEWLIDSDGKRVMINKPDWKAAKWLLEKNDQEEYGEKSEVNINTNIASQGGSILIPIIDMKNTNAIEDFNAAIEESQKNLEKEINKQ